MKILIPGLIVFTVWCVISVRWYVCGIHELCDSGQSTTSQQEETSPDPLLEEVFLETYQAPLAFEWSSADPITNEEFTAFKDSLVEVFDRSPAAVVEITGLYDQQEINNSEFENLGLARAQNIKQLLLNSGIKRSIRVNSKTADLSSGLGGKINQAVSFSLMPQEAPSTDFIISEAKNKLVIHFPTNSASPESNQQVRKALKKIAGSAIRNDNNLLVVGHTDNHGEALENKKLGLVRATKVKDLLISYGMPEKSILAESEGEAIPLVSNNTQRGRQQNRRVEIIKI
jgi:outer membrane protein OmpA-like peptidoglycan-associated protein